MIEFSRLDGSIERAICGTEYCDLNEWSYLLNSSAQENVTDMLPEQASTCSTGSSED